MQFQLSIDIPKLLHPINYSSHIALFGSCFTENVSNFFSRACFNTKFNSHGILFNPFSVCKAINDSVDNVAYNQNDLFYLNEVYNSWYHHSLFSDIEKEQTLQKINNNISEFHNYLKKCDTVIITLGSAFAYNLLEKNIYVSNNHRAPLQWFRKDLLSVETIINELNKTIQKLKNHCSPKAQILFTISPVRHIRDGVIENNRSKARLIEAVHSVVESNETTYYFPSYEIVMDVLRDYRFYDIDLVHPNYAATQFVWEKFKEACISPEALSFIPEFESLTNALNHKPFQPNTNAHRNFLETHLQKAKDLQTQFPFLDLSKYKEYFEYGLNG